MNLSTLPQTVATKPNRSVNAIIACDVSKDNINLIAMFGKFRFERDIDNQTDIIEKELVHLKSIARRVNLAHIQVVAEPTGNYHKTLFSVAKRLDMHTAFVSPEAVAKIHVIETNDTGKTDLKDPNVIHTLATIGKILRRYKSYDSRFKTFS